MKNKNNIFQKDIEDIESGKMTVEEKEKEITKSFENSVKNLLK